LAELSMPRFYAKLSELEAKTRSDHVRIAWYGDSHVHADYWPNAVRRKLCSRFGHGGPGFVRIGLKSYRHSLARAERIGTWQQEPRAPSSRVTVGDGVFGLGGMRTIPASPKSAATLAPLAGSLSGDVHFELSYRALADDELIVEVGDITRRLRGSSESLTQVRREHIRGKASSELRVRLGRGAPQVFGVVVEGTEPGLVIDTLGIDGARAATPLAWKEDAFVEVLRARRSDLVVFAYGTNEVFDDLAPEKYLAHYRALVGLARQALPEAECLIIGPPDAAAEQLTSHPRVVTISAVQRRAAVELGCAFFSAADAMGGLGSFVDWARQSPPLARWDRVHLTQAGYERLGEATADALLEAYSALAGTAR
jgi:lysophospholipase L1-like esterase